jgi:hypothetical protein
MGNDFSSPTYVQGRTRYSDATTEFRKRRRRDQDKESQASTHFLYDLLDFDNDSVGETAPRVIHRSVKKQVFHIVDENGNTVIVTPRSTLWYGLYVKNPPLHLAKFLRKFRRRFRLPYDKFVELVAIAKEATDDKGNLYFRRWMSADMTGCESSPLELMILGALRYLGRGWAFDDIEEATAISEAPWPW